MAASKSERYNKEVETRPGSVIPIPNRYRGIFKYRYRPRSSGNITLVEQMHINNNKKKTKKANQFHILIIFYVNAGLQNLLHSKQQSFVNRRRSPSVYWCRLINQQRMMSVCFGGREYGKSAAPSRHLRTGAVSFLLLDYWTTTTNTTLQCHFWWK